MDKCVVCKNKLNDYTVVWNNVRGDTANTCQIVRCNVCAHEQLIGYNEDLKKHYDEDCQTKDVINNLKVPFEDIFQKEQIECHLRVKYLESLMDLNDKKIIDIGSGYLTFPVILKNMVNCIVSAVEPSKGRFEIAANHPVSCNFYNAIEEIETYETCLKDDFSCEHSEEYDLVTLWHVLEHISSDEIDCLLCNMMKICKKGGCIFIEVPNGNDELLKIEKYRNIAFIRSE